MNYCPTDAFSPAGGGTVFVTVAPFVLTKFALDPEGVEKARSQSR